MVGILLAGNIKGRITKDMYAGMLVFAGVLAGAACLIFILLTYIPIPVVDDIKDSIVYNGGNLIYGKNDYPEGSFKRFHTVETNGSKKLHIEMSEPAVMYLRGYVGSMQICRCQILYRLRLKTWLQAVNINICLKI